MRTNGTLQVWQSAEDDRLDCNGELVVAAGSWGEAVECSVNTNTDTRKGVYQDGNYRHASFTVLTEAPIPYPTGRIRLTRYDEALGEYDVLSIEKMPTVGRVRIIV